MISGVSRKNKGQGLVNFQMIEGGSSGTAEFSRRKKESIFSVRLFFNSELYHVHWSKFNVNLRYSSTIKWQQYIENSLATIGKFQSDFIYQSIDTISHFPTCLP